MPLAIADSSLWIRSDSRLVALTELAGGPTLRVCPPVVQEVLQGAGDLIRYEKLRLLFLDVPMLDEDVPLERYEQAASIYLQCRDKGLTVRSSVDCLIAAIAIAHGVRLLHDDRDFDHIASVTTLDAVRV